MSRTIVLFTAKILLGIFAVLCIAGCDSATSFSETQQQLYDILEQQELPPESRYTIINRIANNLLAAEEYNQLIIFLTSYVEENPGDTYNAY